MHVSPDSALYIHFWIELKGFSKEPSAFSRPVLETYKLRKFVGDCDGGGGGDGDLCKGNGGGGGDGGDLCKGNGGDGGDGGDLCKGNGGGGE